MVISCQSASCQTGMEEQEWIWLPVNVLTSEQLKTSTLAVCGVVSAALQLEESLRCSRSRHLILKASLTNESFITLIVESVGVCLCVSGLQKQCHFDGFFHFFSTLYESAGKFAGSPNKGQCVCPHEAWSRLWRGARHLWDGGPHQQVSALTPLFFVAFKSKDSKVFVRHHTPFLS